MKYVIFPGTSGNYLSTPDVNLLDSDSANGVQDTGMWKKNTGTDPVIVVDASAPFGGSAVELVPDSLSTIFKTDNNAAGSPAASPDIEYTIATTLRVDSAKPDRSVRLSIQWKDAAGNGLSTSLGLTTPLVDGGYVVVSSTGVAPTDTAYGRIYADVIDGGALDGSETFRIGSVIQRIGPDSTFYPSFRIVGDLEAEAKVNVPAHTGEWRAFISTAFNEDGFMLRQEQSSPVAGLLHADGTWRAGESTNQIPADQWMTIQGMAELGVEYRFVFNNVPAGSDSINSNPGVPSGKDMTIGTWLSGSGPDQDFIGSMSYALARDGIDGPVVARFDAEDIVLP